jgi:hypothetical protein
MQEYSQGGVTDLIFDAVKSLEEPLQQLQIGLHDLEICAATLPVAVFRLEPVREAILWHPRGTLLRDTFRRLSDVIEEAAQLATEWNGSATRFRGQQPDDEATTNLKSALLVVNAAWAAFGDAFDRLAASAR